MSKKAHGMYYFSFSRLWNFEFLFPFISGTCDKPVQDNLRWNVDRAKADKICCFNRHFAEHGGYFKTTEFYDVLKKKIDEKETEPMTFYDSVTGKPLFIAPKERSYSEFLQGVFYLI